jgi:hypothetical protein
MAIRFVSKATVKNKLPRSSNIWDGTAVFNPFTLVGNYDALATVTVAAGGVSSISFAGIPTTGYSHLQVRAIVRDTGASYGYNVRLRFNGDSGSNYTRHQLEGNGSSVSASGSSSAETSIPIAMTTGGTNLTGNFASFILDVLDYANTNKNKTARCLLGYDDNGSGYANLRSGSYMQTTAISSMTFESTGTLFAQYSQFALYGIK